MKRELFLAATLVLAAAPIHADYQKGNQTLQLNWGYEGFPNEVRTNNGDDALNTNGGVGGLEYFYFLRSGPTVAVGPDLLWAQISAPDNSSILPNSTSHGATYIAMYQALAKLILPKGHFRPFLLAGAGVGRFSLQADVTPGPGITWADTHTSEPRQTIDSIRWGPIATVGFGLDLFLTERWFLGFQYRNVFFPALMHQPTAAGQALGVQPVRDARSMINVIVDIGYKFGAN